MNSLRMVVIVTVCLVAVPVVVFAQLEFEWASTADGRWQQGDTLENMEVHEATGTVFLAGESWGYDPVTGETTGDILTAAFGADGNRLWTRIYWGTDERPWNFAWEMALDQFNGVVVTSGEVWLRNSPPPGESSYNFLAIGYDLDGDTVFESQYEPNGYDYRQYGLVHNPVTGRFFSGVSGPGISAIRWHANGAIDTFAEPPFVSGFDSARTFDVAVSGLTGNSYVSGRLRRSNGSNDFAASYDTAGNLRWFKERPVALNFSHPYDMTHASATGNTYVLVRQSRQSTGISSWGYQLVAYDDLGNELWSTAFMPVSESGRHYHTVAYDAVSDQVVITGNPNNDVETRAFDGSTGAERWVRSYGDPAYRYRRSWNMALDSAGNIYVTAQEAPPGTSNYESVIVSYDATGAERFVETIQVTDLYFRSYEIHVDGLLNIYISGGGCFAPCPNDYDFAVVKYSQLPTLEAIASEVQELVTDGTLNNGEGTSLISKLNGSAAAMDRDNTEAAVGQLTAFIAQTEALVLSGRLTQAEANALITAAQTLIDSL